MAKTKITKVIKLEPKDIVISMLSSKFYVMFNFLIHHVLLPNKDIIVCYRLVYATNRVNSLLELIIYRLNLSDKSI